MRVWSLSRPPRPPRVATPPGATGSSSSFPPLVRLLPLIYWRRAEKFWAKYRELAARTHRRRVRQGSSGDPRARRPVRGADSSPAVLPRVAVLASLSCGWHGNCRLRGAGGLEKWGLPPPGSVDKPGAAHRRTRRRPRLRSVQVSAGTPAEMVLGCWGPEGVGTRKGCGLGGATSHRRTGVCLLSPREEPAGGAAPGKGDAVAAGARLRGCRAGVLL